MRLLGLQNFLPPQGYGYGAICRDVMQELAARGHRVEVLCAGGDDGRGLDVRRELVHVPAAWRRPVAGLRAEARNQAAVRRAIDRGVDAVLAWHLRGIGKGALTLLHDAGIPVVYLLGDRWVVYERPGPPGLWAFWQAVDRFAAYRCARRVAGRVAGGGRVCLQPPPIAREGIVVFASRWLRERHADVGFVPRHAHVIPNGIRLERFADAASSRAAESLEVAFAGRLDASKGADIAIDALAAVPQARLTLAGDGDRQALADRARGLGVADRVRFAGLLDADGIAALLRRADVFVMPGRIEEAFGLVYLEAMAAGSVVVGTATGGAAEFCRDGENALVVSPDPSATATALRRLADDPELAERLVAAGRRTAAEHSLRAMVDRLEELLPDAPPASPDTPGRSTGSSPR